MLRPPVSKLPKLQPNRRRSAKNEKKLSVSEQPKPKNKRKKIEESRWRKKLNKKLKENSMRSFKWKSESRKKKLRKP